MTTEERTDKQKALDCYSRMEQEGSDMLKHWEAISDVLLPRRGQFLSGSDKDKLQAKYIKIIGSEGLIANRTLAAGLYTGLVNPYTVWAKVGLEDKGLETFGPVKNWLETATTSVMQLLLNTNFYRATFSLLGELGGFGTIAMMVERDRDDVVRFTPFTIGQYYIARDYKGKVDTIGRKLYMNAIQLVGEFGYDNCSAGVQSSYDKRDYTASYEFYHLIKPNQESNRESLSNKDMPFSSQYFEATGDKFLRESGFVDFPIVSTVWEERPGDTYGGCPGMDALGSVNMLQTMEKDKLKAIKKENDPPLIADPQLRDKKKSVTPGGMTYDPNISTAGMRPVYQISPNIGNLQFAIQEARNEINRLFFADLFFLITSSTGQQTATEVLRKEEEKLWMLGPIVSRFTDDYLKPIFFKTFFFALEAGYIPEPPQEIQGAEMRLEYLGPIAQAQKASGLAPIEQMSAFIGNMASVKPEAIDRLNVDDTIEVYADKIGVDPRVINPIDQANLLRQKRAQQQAQVQQAGQEQINAQNAKVLSETDVGGGNNALELMLNQGG